MTNPGTVIDHTRRSVSVPRRLMPSILAIHAGQSPHPATTVDELRAGGVVTDNRLDPLVTTLVEVMTNPTLVITVELSLEHQTRLATFWGTARRAVVGLSDDRHRFELMQVEPNLLPFHLAQTTDMSPLPTLPFAGSFYLPATTLHRVETSSGHDPSQALAALLAAGVPHKWADRFMTALTLRRSLWTVESVWLGRDAPRTESRLSVLDSGCAGYWRLAADDDGAISVTTSSFEDVMRRFSALLPTPRPPLTRM